MIRTRRFSRSVSILFWGVLMGLLPQQIQAQRHEPNLSEGAVETRVFSVKLNDQKSPVVYLKDAAGKRFLPILIGPCEATAIWRRLNDVSFPRPLTHDLLKSILVAANIRVVSILVDQLRPIADRDSGTYFAIMTLRQPDGHTLKIDARPSDAMALAVRLDLPIYVGRKILEENSFSFKEQPQAPELTPEITPPQKGFY